MDNNVVTTKVEYTEDGQLSILFPPTFIDDLGLIDGQVLQWHVIDEDTLTIKKINLISPNT